jgi:hypothetical protein
MDAAHVLTVIVLAAQGLGLVSVWMARRSEGSRYQSWCQQLFVASLLIVGGANLLAMQVGTGCWLACGTTFSVMVVGGTCEFAREPAVPAID